MSKPILPGNKHRKNTRRAVGKRRHNSPRTKVRTVSLQELGPEGGIVKLSELLAEDGGDDAVDSHLETVAERYPDFPRPGHPPVGDGERKFVFLFDPDSIVDRVKATSTVITNPERARLQKVKAAIVEMGGDDPPIKFGNCTEGCKAWRELRRSFGVPVDSGSEEQLLDIWDPEGADDEDEEEDEDAA